MPRSPALFLAWLLLSPAVGPEVRIATLSGEEVLSPSVEIEPAGKVTLPKDDGQVTLALQDLRSITFTGREASPPSGSRLYLAGGGVLLGDLIGASDKSVRIRSPHIREVEIPLSGIRAFRLSAAEVDDSPFLQQMERDIGSDSIFVLQEGKLFRVPGAFRTLDADALSLVWEGQEKVISREKVFGLVLSGGATTGDDEPARATLRDGSQFEGEILDLRGGLLRLRLSSGATVSISEKALVRIALRSHRLVFLSDLEPEKVEEVPYFDRVWSHQKDRSLDGGPIRLGGRTFEKGLSVHSKCRLTFHLGGEFETFSAVVGIDEETKELGHVVFRVFGDGKTLFDSGGVGGADDPRQVRINVAGKEKLVLEVDFGEDLDIGDHADWADAHLVRKS